MPTITVDYMQVGHATTIRIPMFTYRKGELTAGTKVIVQGDGVDDQIGVVDGWIGNQVRISIVRPQAPSVVG
jgi:hypothetical protein